MQRTTVLGPNQRRGFTLIELLVVIAIIATLDIIFSLLDQLADTDENYTTANALAFVLFTLAFVLTLVYLFGQARALVKTLRRGEPFAAISSRAARSKAS